MVTTPHLLTRSTCFCSQYLICSARIYQHSLQLYAQLSTVVFDCVYDPWVPIHHHQPLLWMFGPSDSGSHCVEAFWLTTCLRFIEEWIMSIGTSYNECWQIQRLLDSKFLLRKRVRKRVRREDNPRGLRFLFRYHFTKILGWKERRHEGDPWGFN